MNQLIDKAMESTFPNQNLLSNATSPYLLQHADNPVFWREWDTPAFEEAKLLDKPILLSIGYAACHWCHVMAHESFENQTIADQMNRFFVNIKVDREERPDIDQIYMNSLQAMGEQGGWPLTIFLTPDAKPFWGGTYFPPTPKFGRPGFPQILDAISNAYHQDRTRVLANTEAITKHLSSDNTDVATDSVPPISVFSNLVEQVLRMQDPVNGGVGSAPKFPNITMLENLARAGKPENKAQDAFIHSITRISKGGIYDHVGGGLCRYSVDEAWLVPHFEKMLYDNAHFIRASTWVWQKTRSDLFRTRIEETVAWLIREMTSSDGAFYSSLDADSEGEEGKFYVWDYKELQQLAGDEINLLEKYYNVSRSGNWEGSNILNPQDTSEPVSSDSKTLRILLTKLLEQRSKRVRPGTDDKILTDWNGYMIRALIEASEIFEKAEWQDLALKAFHFISESISEDGRLPHSHRNGRSKFPGILTDYASMANAAISIYEVVSDNSYLDKANRWLAILKDEHSDESGQYYLSNSSVDDLFIRPVGDADEANPSGSSQVLEALVRLSHHKEDTALMNQAEKLVSRVYGDGNKASLGLSGLANGLHELHRHRHIKIFAQTKEDELSFIKALRNIPRLATSVSITRIAPTGHFGSQVASPIDKACAIVCTSQTCSAPLNSSKELSDYLATH